MKNRTFSYYVVLLCFIGLISCKDNKEVLREPDAYYLEYLKKAFEDNNIVETPSFKIDYSNFELDDKLSHDELIFEIDSKVQLLKRILETNRQQELERVNVLIKVVKENNLEHKEEFYEKLLRAKTDDQKIDLYAKELKEFFSKLEIAKLKNDPDLSTKVANEYSYLTVLAKDDNGNYVNKTGLHVKEGLNYSIAKYDKVYNKKQNATSRSKNSVVYVNGVQIK
ncbi:hypothetical protein [Gelatiniphilus marinus]|uniref:Uncharacterized protein n=1 Tax=Gelatiniphilus marinus TaxID=1759464 RepID=A0ABW5JR35_9FLAO